MSAPKLTKILTSKIFRFLFFGGLTALFNLVVFDYLMEAFQVETPFMENIVNADAIEISIIFNFFVYRFVV
ncbi:MAG: hypothetical protein AAGG02_20900, partial [Cyanobacteria bacterium P01_H01_bin.15]